MTNATSWVMKFAEQTAKLSIAPDMQLVGQSSTLALHALSLQVAA